MCLRKRWIEFQRLAGCADHFWAHFTRRGPADARCAELVVRACQGNISRCKRRILLDRLLKVNNTFLYSSSVVAVGELPLEIALINLRRDLAHGDKPGTLLSRDRHPHSSRNGLRHIALKSKRVPQFAIVHFRPEVFVSRAPNQLGMDANPTAISYDR